MDKKEVVETHEEKRKKAAHKRSKSGFHPASMFK